MAKADHTSSTPITERRLKIAADFYPVHIKENLTAPPNRCHGSGYAACGYGRQDSR